MQQIRNDFRGDGKTGVLQRLQSRVQSVIRRPGRGTRDLEQIVHLGLPFNIDDLPAFVDAIENLHGTINDRKFLLEKVLTIMARLPGDSNFAKITQQHVINLLYKDLLHPPTGFLSTFHNTPSTTAEELSYAFRSADGSNYNVLFPSLGQAGQPYARSVPSTHIQSLSSLPDPGVVFDDLLCRRPGDFVPHPGGLSSLFFAFADLIIHSIFNTNTCDWTRNDASSYLDLSIIYGSSVEQVESMRKKDGTGKVWNDAFADSRLLFMPPSVCALAVLFSRHHNYIAQKIIDLNERGSFISPQSEETATFLLAQDDEIFHRARMVNTAFFVQIILADYVGGILGLLRDGLTWRLDPLASFRESDHAFFPRGHGNAVSIEFNLLYHWHACIGEQDEKYLNKLVEELFKGGDLKMMTIEDFRQGVREKLVPSEDVKTWTFNGLKRGPDGSFSNEDLARILQNATEQRAGAFRARGCPPIMKVVEILAIEQGRKWGACTLNEFRKFMGLRPYKSFEEWNPDRSVHSAAERLYGHIDNLELHVGLQAEETKPPIPGAGLCPGYTISRAILADAVYLSRGDRFLTVDFTPYNLTNWGYEHCMVDTADGSYGGMLSKLLFNLLPDHYPAGSIYANFPLMTPDFMHSCISSRSRASLTYYDFLRPSPAAGDLDVLYTKRVLRLTKGVDVMALREVRDSFVKQTLPVVSFTGMFKTMLKKAFVSKNQTTRTVERLKDVINQAPIHWLANFVLGLPITEVDYVLGGHAIEQWSELFADVTRYMYLNDDPVRDWVLYQEALKATDEITHCIHIRLKRCEGTISLCGAFETLVTSLIANNVQNDRFVADIVAKLEHDTVRTIAYNVFAETVPSALVFSAAIVRVVDYYADPSRKAELRELIRLSTTATEDTGKVLTKFIDDALGESLGASGSTHNGIAEQDRQDGPLAPRYLIVETHKVEIRRLGGLMSQDVFPKLVPHVIAAIYSLDGIDFSDA